MNFICATDMSVDAEWTDSGTMQMRAGGPHPIEIYDARRASCPHYGGDDDGGEQDARPILTITMTMMTTMARCLPTINLGQCICIG